jgi:hypothetical protein
VREGFDDEPDEEVARGDLHEGCEEGGADETYGGEKEGYLACDRS